MRRLARRLEPEAEGRQRKLRHVDTEVDAGYFDRLKDSLSKTHLLEFDADEGATTVRSGYFWEGTTVAAHQA